MAWSGPRGWRRGGTGQVAMPAPRMPAGVAGLGRQDDDRGRGGYDAGLMPENTTPVPLLFFIADTGGGHRNAAKAVGQALDRAYPGRFAPVLCDPLSGTGAARLLRWVVGLYGPTIRLAPWLWGAAYHASDSPLAMALLWRTVLRLARAPAANAVAAHRPAAIVSFHPLTGMTAIAARGRTRHEVPVVTVVTDLVSVHASWRCPDVDLVIAPPDRPPVTRDFWSGPPRPGERAILRRSLGLSEHRLTVVLTGGGEGCGGIGRRAAAILRRFGDVDVVALCGRNLRLKSRLTRLAARYGGRLTVLGFTDNMADWLRCADLLVTKAGPGTIAEAACCGAPLLLTSHLPGQERGNTELVTAAGACRRVRGVRRLLSEIGLAARRSCRAGRDARGVRRPGQAGRRGRYGRTDRRAGPPLPAAGAAGAAGMGPLMVTELRVRRAARPLTERWRHVPVEPRGTTPLGISFRPLQAVALGLDPAAALDTLLAYPFQLIRLSAYWNRLEPEPGGFQPAELDRQLDAAERAGKQVIVCVGAVKAFGYPEFFVPPHHLPEPLREGVLVRPDGHERLLRAATEFITRVVARYRDRAAIIAWQVEHDAVDPLGMEHSWRLAEPFVRTEVEAVRAADPGRPVLMNGFLPTSTPVRVQQWWRTRDQGDSLAVAERLADIVGIDFYPRHAVASAGPLTLYLDGSKTSRQRGRRERLLDRAAEAGQRIMLTEGQAEPWEAVTTPPSPAGRVMYSCRPEDLIGTYSQCMRWQDGLAGYLFWGAEYWLLRAQQGDPSYLRAFSRVLDSA